MLTGLIKNRVFLNHLKHTLKMTDEAASAVNNYAVKYGESVLPKMTNIVDFGEQHVKDTVKKGYTLRRSEELLSNLDEVLKDIKPKKELSYSENVKNFVDTRIKTTSAAAQEVFGFTVDKFERGLHQKGGNSLYKMYQWAYQNPRKLKETMNISNKDMFKALSVPGLAKNDMLRALGESFQEMDSVLVEKLKLVTSNTFDARAGYVFPLSPNPGVVESLGEKGFAEIIAKYTLSSEKAAQKISKEYFKNLRSAGPRNIKVDFDPRKLRFSQKGDLSEEGLDNMFEYFKAVSGLNDDASVIAGAVGYKEKAIEKAYFFREFGDDAESTIKGLYHKAKLGKGDDQTLKELASGFNTNIRRLENALGYASEEYNTLKYWMLGLDKGMSAIYGAPGSFIRNAVIDFTGHAAVIQSSLLQGQQGVIGFMSDRFFKPIGLMIKGVADTRGTRKALGEFLDVFDFGMTNNSMFASKGIRGENFHADIDGITTASTKSEKYARGFNEATGRFNNFMQGIAGNMLHYDATSALNVAKSAQAFTNLVLKNTNYKSFLDAMGPMGRKYLKWNFDLGEREIGALIESAQHLKAKLPSPKIKRALGFNDTEILFPKQLSKMDDSIARKWKMPTETAEQFKERVRVSYHSMLTHQRNLSQTGLSKANRLTDEGFMKGSFIEVMLRPFAKFADITHAQHYDGLRVGLSMAMYGSPYNTGYMTQLSTKKGLFYWARAMSFYGGSAITAVWIKDLLQGRTPRSITPKQLALVMAGSGVGGLPASVFQQTFHTGMKGSTNFWEGSPFGDWLIDMQELFKNMNNQRAYYKGAKFIQKTSGVGKLWWSRGMVDNLINKAFLDPHERIYLDSWYEKQLGSRNIFRSE